MNQSAIRLVVTLVTALAAPVVFGFDLIARQLVIGSQPVELQDFMQEHVTRLAWWALPLPLTGCVVGVLLYPRLYKKFLARHRANPPPGSTPEHRADLEALFLSATVVQLPALLGDFSVLLGARLGPALCSMSISTVSVLLIAWLGRRATRGASAPGAM